MRNAILAVLMFCGVCSSTALLAQLPVPSALLESRTVFLTGQNIEREWLDWAAEEIRKLDRFELMGDQEDADLTFTVIRWDSREGVAAVPITGVGVIAVPLDQEGVSLAVHTKGGRLVWDDSREINWLASGAVKDLIRDLHKAVGQNQRRVDSFDLKAAMVEPVDVLWGLEPCSRWQAARLNESDESPVVVSLITSWVDGFVSMFSLATGNRTPPDSLFDPLTTASGLDDFCRENPEEFIASAANWYAYDLLGKQ